MIEQPVDQPAAPVANQPVDEIIRKIENIDNRLEDIASHHRIAADHISPNLYEESPGSEPEVESDMEAYTDDENYENEDLTESDYNDPEENNPMSW